MKKNYQWHTWFWVACRIIKATNTNAIIIMEPQFFGSCVFCVPLDRYIDWHIRRYVGQHIDQCLVDMLVNIWSTYRPTIGRYLGRYSGWHSADTLTDAYRRNIGQPSLVYRSTLLKYMSKVETLTVRCRSYTHFIHFQRPGKKIWKLDTSSSIFPTAPRQRWNPHPWEGFANQIPHSPVMVR